MRKDTCETCYHYTSLGLEDSGLLLPDKSAAWLYVIGRCNNSESVHSGRDNLPDFISCWLWKKKKRA